MSAYDFYLGSPPFPAERTSAPFRYNNPYDLPSLYDIPRCQSSRAHALALYDNRAISQLQLRQILMQVQQTPMRQRAGRGGARGGGCGRLSCRWGERGAFKCAAMGMGRRCMIGGGYGWGPYCGWV